MKGASRAVVAGALAVLAAGIVACGGDPGIAGRWTGQDAGGNRMTFDFRDGGEGDWIVQVVGAAPETIGMRYALDPSADPNAIDLSDFESGPLQGFTMAGIYELAGDTLRIDFEPVQDPSEADAARPDAFTDSAVPFVRAEGGE